LEAGEEIESCYGGLTTKKKRKKLALDHGSEETALSSPERKVDLAVLDVNQYILEL